MQGLRRTACLLFTLQGPLPRLHLRTAALSGTWTFRSCAAFCPTPAHFSDDVFFFSISRLQPPPQGKHTNEEAQAFSDPFNRADAAERLSINWRNK